MSDAAFLGMTDVILSHCLYNLSTGSESCRGTLGSRLCDQPKMVERPRNN